MPALILPWRCKSKVWTSSRNGKRSPAIGITMQKTNTLLLVIIAGLLAGLLLRPAARRYEVFQQNYLLDTASGRVVMIQVSKEVRADQRAKEAAKQADKNAAEAREKAYTEERLSKSCPEVLAKPLPKSRRARRERSQISPILLRALSWS